MTASPSPGEIWIVDPAHLTPHYDHALADAVATLAGETGDGKVRFIASPFRLDSDIELPKSFAYEEHYFRGPGLLLQSRIGPVRQLARLAWYPLDHRRLLARAKRERPRVVHLQWSRLPKVDHWLIARLQAIGIPVVHTIHDVEPLYKNTGGRAALERVFAACDALIVHTKANRDELLSIYPSIEPDRVFIVPMGPHQAETRPADATPEKARRELDIPEGVPVALFFGVIKRYKGLDVLLAAWPAVQKALPDARLLVVGKPGGPADSPDLAPLVSQGCHILPTLDYVANRDIWRYYLACDLVVLPYRSITASGVLLTTLAYGRATLATRVGGLPELVREGETGWLVPPEDPAALARSLIDALRDRGRLMKMGVAATRLAETDFSWRRSAELTLAAYESARRRRNAALKR